MNWTQILPIIIVVEMLAASIPLFWTKQWGSAIYWLSIGIANSAVIFLIGGK